MDALQAWQGAVSEVLWQLPLLGSAEQGRCNGSKPMAHRKSGQQAPEQDPAMRRQGLLHTHLQMKSAGERQPKMRKQVPTGPRLSRLSRCWMKPLHGARPVPAATMTTPLMAFMGSLKVGTCGKTGARFVGFSLTDGHLEAYIRECVTT